MFRRRRSADDFAEEIKSHIEHQADALESEGLSEEEAYRRARVELIQLKIVLLAAMPSARVRIATEVKLGFLIS